MTAGSARGAERPRRVRRHPVPPGRRRPDPTSSRPRNLLFQRAHRRRLQVNLLSLVNSSGRPRRRIGVPLIVGIVVLAILVVGAAVSGPVIIITMNARQVAQRKTCISNQRNVEAAIQEYAVESPDENYPSSLQDLVNASLLKSAPTCPSGHKPYVWVKGQPGIAPYISCPNNSTHEQ